MTTTTVTRASGVSVSQKCLIEALNYFEVCWDGEQMDRQTDHLSDEHCIIRSERERKNQKNFEFFFKNKDPFQERTVDETYTLIHSPVSAITPTSTSIEFHVPGVSDFLSPRHCLVDLTFKVRPEVNPQMGKPTN